MLVPQLLLETLEDLSHDDFDKFKFYLGVKILNNCNQIPRSHLESAHRHDAVSKMVESHGEETAVILTAAILRMMNKNNAAEGLVKAYAEGVAAVARACATSSSASGLPAVQQTSAADDVGAQAPIATSSGVTISGDVRIIIGGNGCMIIRA